MMNGEVLWSESVFKAALVAALVALSTPAVARADRPIQPVASLEEAMAAATGGDAAAMHPQPRYTQRGGVGANSLHAFVDSIPFWGSTFTYDGVTYPYYMVGHDLPESGGVTNVQNTLTVLTFVFDAYGGYTLDGNDILANTLASPVYAPADYSAGEGIQFGDAIQRATFWNRMKPNGNWHVSLATPHVNPGVTVHVPPGAAYLFQLRNGTVFALMDADFLISILDGLTPDWRAGSLPVTIAYNTLLYIGNPGNCCILGFHGAYLSRFQGVQKISLQTYAWASWSSLGIFRAPIADIHALSHEIAEWLDDPFIINQTPPWSAPGYGCDDTLEVGDPIVGSTYLMTMNGYTYHPQNQALLPWFAREVPSSALGGAYSYPDASVLTGPSTGCD